MSVEVSVGQPPKHGEVKLSLNIRKTIDGNIVLRDHDDIDIVVMPNKKKVITFPKKSYHDDVYSTQERLFNFLSSKGVITRESVQAGEVYGSIEGQYPDAVGGADATQLLTYTIGLFLEEEKPHIQAEKEYDEEFERELTAPDAEESTELGEISQNEKKGSLDIGKIRKYLSGNSPY